MDEKTATLLREPFPAEKVGKLPRVTCGNCRESRDRVCDKHQKVRCGECGSWITTGHIHLDYVGHADVTDRLLAADPGWTWEPFALDSRGLPALDDNGGLWIRLTICGVTRIGYGDADGKRGPSAVKETIGDALRNASMRFGVALDLWRKEFHDNDTPQRQQERSPKGQTVKSKARAAIAAAESRDALEKIGRYITTLVEENKLTDADAVDLRRALVARLDELYPAAQDPQQEWPEPAEVPT